jgi:hypothetical protein
MPQRLNTYTAYSVGCFIVWAVLIVVGVMTGHGGEPNHSLLFLVFGWFLGWLSATIARSVYPPPGARRPPHGTSTIGGETA